jgi:hypothetical protein
VPISEHSIHLLRVLNIDELSGPACSPGGITYDVKDAIQYAIPLNGLRIM